MAETLSTRWIWRSREPAKCPANENFPYGRATDTSGGLPSCEVELAYPAPGVGTWVVTCAICGLSIGITAAGRADDPTKVRFPCKSKVAPHA